MSTDFVREVISSVSPTSISLSNDETDEGVFIKGFASVQTMDRHGDIVPPEEFNIEKFLTSPTVLINHKYWVDEKGNEVSVGKAESVYVATLRDKDAENYSVVNDAGEETTTFPKSAAPDLSDGARGLFVVLKVTDPDIVAKVKKGEFSAFSWRGLSSAEFTGSGARPIRILRDIDLFEISLVDIPANSDATFVIGKSEGFEEIQGPLVVYAVELSKSSFNSFEDASKYLSGRGLACDEIKENEKTYCSFLCSEVDQKNLVRVSMEKGVSVIAGPPNDKLMDTWRVAEEVSSDFGKDFQSISTTEVPRMSKITLEAEDIFVSTQEEKGVPPTTNRSSIDLGKVHKGKVPAFNLRHDSIKSEEGEDSDEGSYTLEDIVTAASKGAVDQLAPALKTLADNQAKLAEQLSAMKPQPTEAKKEVSDEIETVVEDSETVKSEDGETSEDTTDDEGVIDNITKSILMIAERLDEVGKKVDNLSGVEDIVSDLRKAVPTQMDRRESISKSVSGNDPNSVFDNHPIFSGSFLNNL